MKEARPGIQQMQPNKLEPARPRLPTPTDEATP